MPHETTIAIACCALLLGACDDDSAAAPKESESVIAKALTLHQEEDATKKAEEEKFLAEYKARKEAEEARAAAEFTAALEGITVQPERPAPSVKAACNDAADAFDVMMKKRFAEDAKELRLYYDRRRVDRAEVREKCRMVSLEAANCYAHALWKVPPLLYPHDTDILRRCTEKFDRAGPTAEG